MSTQSSLSTSSPRASSTRQQSPTTQSRTVLLSDSTATLMERARAMINDAGLPKELWAEAVNTANYIRCRSPTAKKLKTPWELFYNQKPDVSQMRIFGATAYSHVPKEKRQKLDDRSIRGIMVGYAAHAKGYRILLEDHTVIISRDVIFDESVGATKVNGSHQPQLLIGWWWLTSKLVTEVK